MNTRTRLARLESATAAKTKAARVPIYGGVVILDADAKPLAEKKIAGLDFYFLFENYFDRPGAFEVDRRWVWIIKNADGTIAPEDAARAEELKRMAEVCPEWKFNARDMALIVSFYESLAEEARV